MPEKIENAKSTWISFGNKKTNGKKMKIHEKKVSGQVNESFFEKSREY